MTYDSRETSLQDAAPVELYIFERLGKIWRFTNANVDQIDGLHTYKATSIRRNAIDQTVDTARTSLTLTTHSDMEFVTQFYNSVPADLILVTVKTFHLGDAISTDSAVTWMGRVSSIKFRGLETDILCEPIHASMKRHLLRRRYQRTCPHVLYNQHTCKLNQEAWQVISPDTEQSGRVLTSPVFATFADGWFSGGFVEYPTGGSIEFRLVTNHVGNALTLDFPLSGFVAGSTILAYPGCDRTVATCDGKFDNLLNYGGQPFYPEKNPMNGTPIY